MKVFIQYQDNEDENLHKILKITLPKSWKSGPISKILSQFVSSYNASKKVTDDGSEILFSRSNPLDESDVHLAMNYKNCYIPSSASKLKPLAIDAIVTDEVPDKAYLYVLHGPSQTLAQLKPSSENKVDDDDSSGMVKCTRFGCQKRFPKGGPYPKCSYHKSPPVFHETAKFWSCCPERKAYDWDDFQNIPGCQTGVCTDEKQTEEAKKFLGGCDMREIAAEQAGVKLKSIDDFNKSQLAGGSPKAAVVVKLRSVLKELDIDEELFDQVVDGMKKGKSDDENAWEEVANELGSKIKDSLKAIVRDQLRIR